jgi:hypothetical protein
MAGSRQPLSLYGIPFSSPISAPKLSLNIIL